MGILKGLKRKVALTIAALMATTMWTPNTTSLVKVNAATTVQNQKIIGYYPSWVGGSIDSQIQFDKLTHINYAFLIPNTDGSLLPIENESIMRDLITKAHAKGVKVLISVGGWSYKNIPLQSTFEALASNTTSRNAFIKNVTKFVNDYGLDGADIDWEYPTSAHAANFKSTILGLRTELNKTGKLLTAAVSAGVMPNGGNSGNGDAVTLEVANNMDWINIMAYDGGNGADHSPYSFAENGLNYWLQKGIAKEKITIGVPFYARPSWDGYNSIVAKDPQAPYRDQSGSDYYNGIDTIKKKATLAKEKAGGVMIWELSQDTMDSTSLLSAIYSVLGSNVQPIEKPLAATVTGSNTDGDGNYDITINVPANNKAKNITISENGQVIEEVVLDGTTSKVITKSFTNKVNGTYKYVATTTNDGGSTVSNELAITVTNGYVPPVDKSTKVVGYVTDWSAINVDKIQYDKLTHINYAFLIPMEDGNVRPITNPILLDQVIQKAHTKGVKVLISVGGWSYNGAELDPTFTKACGNTTTRENLVNNIVKFVNENNLDGADIDWEYPDPGTDADNYEKLMSSLNAKLKPNGKLLTAAVTAGCTPTSAAPGWNLEGVKNTVFQFIDFLNIMAYDGGSGADHSPYSYAENALTVWGKKGLPKEKMVLGLPFYARPSWVNYNEIVKMDSQAPYKDQSGTDFYNGIDTIKKKTKLALEKGSGVMIWELSGDTTDSTSLLKAINDVTGPVNGEVTYDIADFNKNGKVDTTDLASIATQYNNTSASSTWDSKYDLIKDGIVDIYDLVKVASKISSTPVIDPEEPDTSKDTYDPKKVYVGGDTCIYKGITYKAKWWTQGEEPGVASVWEKIN